MDIKRFIAMTLAVVGVGIAAGIGVLIVFSLITAVLILGIIGFAVSLLLMPPERRSLWFDRMKANFKVRANQRRGASKNEDRPP